ncbi:hypothetical protein J1614_010409 [Plenodomus biglobosus]|nr:hypothetical protein J1614_010409 [Plenodomus biglobosus]
MEAATSWPDNSTQADTISPPYSPTTGNFLGSPGTWRPYATGLGTIAVLLFGMGVIYDFLERRGSKHVVLGDCGWWLRRTMMTRFNLDPNNVVFDGYKRVCGHLQLNCDPGVGISSSSTHAPHV